MNLFMLTKIILIAMFMFSNSLANIDQDKYEIQGLRASLYKVEPIIDLVVPRAKEAFYENQANDMVSPIIVIENGQYLSLLDIKPNYVIRFYFFHNTLINSQNYIGHFRESVVLQNKKIGLLPHFSYKDSNGNIINGLPDKDQMIPVEDIEIDYTCFTDIDQNVSNFQDQIQSSTGVKSLITNHTDNKYLKNCIYDPSFLNSAW